MDVGRRRLEQRQVEKVDVRRNRRARIYDLVAQTYTASTETAALSS